MAESLAACNQAFKEFNSEYPEVANYFTFLAAFNAGMKYNEEGIFKAGYRRALEEAEYRVIAEMVCCHIYEEAGQHPDGRGAWMKENKARYRNHDLCYWAGACASLLRDRAAEVGTKDGDDDE